jgi:hypothetical protein
MKPKGHWPAGKRRHPEPPDWPRIRAALDEAAKRRQTRLVAREVEVHPDTIYAWRKGEDLPAPMYVRKLVASLYALKLYWVRTGRNSA